MRIHIVVILIATVLFLGGSIYIVLSGRPVSQLSIEQSVDQNISEEQSDDQQRSEVIAEVQQDDSLSPSPSDGSASGFSLSDISLHASEEDCWTAINGSVYDLSSFVSRHPGGVSKIVQLCGIDGTDLFTKQHGRNNNVQSMLVLLKIGSLQ